MSYLEQAKTDPHEPGSCSFCGQRPVAAWFEGPTFKALVRSSADVRTKEAWLACAECLALVEADDRQALAIRAAQRHGGPVRKERVAMAREMHDEQFWRPRERT